jgi:hypothetical protein
MMPSQASAYPHSSSFPPLSPFPLFPLRLVFLPGIPRPMPIFGTMRALVLSGFTFLHLSISTGGQGPPNLSRLIFQRSSLNHLITSPCCPSALMELVRPKHAIYGEGSLYLRLAEGSVFKFRDASGHSPRYKAERGKASCGLSVLLRFSPPHLTVN